MDRIQRKKKGAFWKSQYGGLEKEFLSGIISLDAPGAPERKSERRGSNPMAEKLDPKEVVSFEEVLLSNVYTQ